MSMGRKLTKVKATSNTGILTKNPTPLFHIILGNDIQKKYCITKLDGDDKGKKSLINFLVKYVNNPVVDVDVNLCKTDVNDKFNGRQIQHYKVSRKFRLFGYYQEGLFHIVRIDPNHEFHK